MATNFLLSDDQLRIICLVNGVCSIVFNALCLYLVVQLRHFFVSNIYVVVVLLEGFYFNQNVVFNFVFIPFIYTEYGGGYCIGIVCSHHIIPFWALYSFYIFETCSISGLFVLLIFFRHQNLMPVGSNLKLKESVAKAFAVLLMIGANVVPLRYAVNSIQLDSAERNILLRQLCPSCDWIELNRNFSVISAYSAKVDGLLVVATVFLYGSFTFACSGHIMFIMRQHRKNSSLRGVKVTVTHSQTRQSLVQVFIFGAFLAIPILLFMSIPLLGVSDGILVPTILLLSLSSLVHSVTLIASTPPFQKHIRRVIFGRGDKPTSEMSTANRTAFTRTVG